MDCFSLFVVSARAMAAAATVEEQERIYCNCFMLRFEYNEIVCIC